MMAYIYLVNISEQFPAFYVFASDQQATIETVNIYLNTNNYNDAPSPEMWSIELIDEAYMGDDSIILSGNP